MYSMKAEDDDILEYALNYGVQGASRRLDVTPDKVIEVVKEFKADIEDNKGCPCQQANNKNNGSYTMCFYCPGPEERIRI